MKRIKQFTSRMLAVLLAGTLAVGSVSVSAFGAEDVGSTVAAAEEFSVEEGTEEGVVEPSSAATVDEEMMTESSSTEVVDGEGVSESPDAAFADTSEIAAEEAAVTSYTVTLDANGGYFANEMDDVLNETLEKTEVLNKIIPVGGTVSTYPVNEQESITTTFLGWSLERDGEILPQEQEGYAPVGNCALYAVWKYDDAADTSVAIGKDVPQEVLNDPIETEEPEAGGSEGEAAQENDSEDALIDETAAEETAEEAPSSYTVTLDANGGFFVNEWDDVLGEYVEHAEILNKVIPVEGGITVVPVNEQDGITATFLGWSLERDGEILPQEQEGYAPVGDSVLYALWEYGNNLIDENKDIAKNESISDLEEVIDSNDDSTDFTDDILTENNYADVSEYGDTTEQVIQEDAQQQDGAWEKQTFISDEDEYNKTHDEPDDIELNYGLEDKNFDLIENEGEEESIKSDALMSEVASGTCGTNLTWILDSNGVLKISGRGRMYDYDSFYDEYIENVPAAPWLIEHAEKINEVVLENGVLNIGDYAFEAAENLQTIVIPDSICEIGESVSHVSNLNIYITSLQSWLSTDFNGSMANEIQLFVNNKLLTEVTIPDGTTELKDFAFYGQNKINHVSFPNSIMRIGKDSFYGCTLLSEITFPDSISTIEVGAFGNCSSLTEIILPNRITTLESYAFSGCNKIKKIYIPDSVENAGGGIFSGSLEIEEATIPQKIVDNYSVVFSYSNLGYIDDTELDVNIQASVILSQNVNKIGDETFLGCEGISNIIMTNSLIDIGKSAFLRCEGLKSINIPDSVESIGAHAFSYCSSLETVILPSSLTSIRDYTFSECSELKEISIPDTVLDIGSHAFYSCWKLKTIKLSSNLEKIGDWAFAGCIVEEISLPDSIKAIDNYVFNGCFSIKSITIPQIVVDNHYVFYNSSAGYYTSIGNDYSKDVPESIVVNLSENVKSIGEKAFDGCSFVTDVVIPESVTSIGDRAFEGCRRLRNITIPSSLTTIGNNIFDCCPSLTNIYIPSVEKWMNDISDLVGYREKHLFIGGREIIDLTIPEGVKNIDTSDFSWCTSLKSVTIPSSVNVIGRYAFSGCHNLSSITIPSSVTSIKGYTFSGCYSLESIIIPSKVTSIEEYAFKDCSSITNIVIPLSVTSIDLDAFEGCDNLKDIYYAGDYDDWKKIFNKYSESYVNIQLNKATIHYNYGQVETVINLDSTYEGMINKEFVINANVTSTNTIPDSSNMTWSIKSSDVEEAAVTWGTMTVQKNDEGIYQISVPVTITEAGAYKLFVDFEGQSAHSIINVNEKTKIQPTFNLSTDTISYKNESLGEKLQLTLKAKNVLSDGEIDSLSQEQKEALCFHVDSIDFKIEGTPVAYFSQVGDEYIQKHEIVPLDDGLDIPIGEEKVFADFEVLTNPPVVISEPVQKAEISYTIKGTLDGKTVELSDKKTVSFLYDFVEQDTPADYTDQVDEWINNEGTQNSIKYLTNSSNFIHYIFVTEKDSGVGGKVTKTLSDLFYRGIEGRQELGADKLSEQEAEQILIDFLNDNEEEINSLANVTESTELAASINDGFKVYLEACLDKMNIELGKDPEGLDRSFYDALYDELVDHLIKSESIGSETIKTLADDSNEIVREIYDDYLQSILFTEKVTKVLGTVGMIGKGIKFLSVNLDTFQQMKEVAVIQTANRIYVEMLDYLEDNCQYSPVKNAARNLSQIFNKNIASTIDHINASLKSYIYETALEDIVVNKSVDVIADFAKASNALKLKVIAAEVGFQAGVLLSNSLCHTKDNQELKDRMRILTAIGDTLGNWIDEGLSGYPSSSGVKKLAFARHIAYGEHILIKTRKLGEISYQKLCENVSTESCDGYRVSKCITSTLATFETWMLRSDILNMVAAGVVYCPVDVDVCDENGNVLITIKDGKEDSGEYGDIQYWSIYNKFDDDYMKIVTYPDNKNYTLRCNGRGEGEVSAFYQEYDNEGCSHCITFEDIPVEKNTVITMDSVSVSSEQFKVKSNGIEEYCTYEKTKKEEEEHSFTSWQILRESTCSSYGLKKRSCDSCSKTELVELPLQEHNWNLEYTIDTVPTSTTPGQKSIHCRNCGTIKEGSVTEISALDAKLIDTGVCGDQINWALYDNGDLMISGSGIMSNWNNTNNFSPWHDHATDVKRVMLTSGIESIGVCAFYDCTNLKEVLIPESINNIGQAAFRYCESLEEVVFPECVTKLQTETFCRCTNLKKVHLSRALTSIDQYAFSYCSSLNEITIPETVESLGKGAFQHCTALTGISLPDGIRTISNSCFYQCSSLKKLVLPARLEAIENYAINRCINLTEIVIPDSVNTVGEYALAGSAFKRIVLPEHLERLGKGAFYTCQNLEEIAIPAKITELGKGMFYGCDKLAKVILSDNIKSIESDAFTKCNNVTIYGLDGSYAQTFAETQNIPFISHNGHNFGEWEVIKAATLEELGLQSHTCKICGMEETQIIPKLEIVSIDDAVVTGIDNMLYTGKSLTQALVVELGSITLKANIDYTVTYKNNINAGTAALTITGIGNYEGTITKEFIINPAPISKVDVTGVVAKSYTGKAITQTPTVILGSTTLARDKDYTISYKNNTNAGTATVTITGKGNYAGTKTATFKINKAAQSITAKAAETSIAVGKTTEVSITGAKGTESFKSSDTTIATVDAKTGKVAAKKVGTVTITATSVATANYNAASKTITIKVLPASISKAAVTCPASKVWAGWALTPVPTVKLGAKTLKKGTDFSLAFKNNKNVGTATITITGKGNYTGTIKKTFKINPKPTSISKLTGGSKKFTATWKKQASQTSGYQIQYSSRSDFKTQNIVTVSGASKTSKTVSGLAKKHKYYVRIRTYKTVGKTKYYSTWSAAKTVTTK